MPHAFGEKQGRVHTADQQSSPHYRRRRHRHQGRRRKSGSVNATYDRLKRATKGRWGPIIVGSLAVGGGLTLFLRWVLPY